MLQLQNTILELIAKGETLKVTTDVLCREIDRLLPAVQCTVLQVGRDGLLHPLSGPGFPPPFPDVSDSLLIGPNVGSCGSSAYLGTPIAVYDIVNDPRWSAYRELPLSLGLYACWSSPIMGALGDVLGTFALYFREKRGPTAHEKEVVAACTHLCTIAFERYDRVMERERRAYVDALTDLPNRASFDAAVARLPTVEPGAWALLLIDVDNLKLVNDTFGHQSGDVLLQTVAARIGLAVAPDHVFRLGGDEFAVIVQTATAVDALEQTAQGVLDALSAPADCGGHILIPRATIGAARFSLGDLDADEVRRHADFSLYHAKEKKRGSIALYTPEFSTSIMHRMESIRDVQIAIREDRISAFYQPAVRLDTREIVGFEALCRLRRPNGDIVPASAFMEATTDARAASALTERMLSIVADDIRAWLDQGLQFQHVGINISSVDFHSGLLFERIEAAFSRKNVPLKHVILEVTESVYLRQNDPGVAQEIRALRDQGLRVALDDFGTGYASLTHLLTVPVDIIKIDKTFIDNLKPGEPSAAIVEGLFGIATKLGIQVIVEGIEREEQAAQLAAFGYRLGQGYLFSPAVPGQVAAEMLSGFGAKTEWHRTAEALAG